MKVISIVYDYPIKIVHIRTPHLVLNSKELHISLKINYILLIQIINFSIFNANKKMNNLLKTIDNKLPFQITKNN
jgi:hypothetical protein